MLYNKPHLTLGEQLDLLESRGLLVHDRTSAIDFLRRVGYYRFAAYAYPFREPLLPGEPRESTVHLRSSSFSRGVTFTSIERLWSFDRQLRLLILDAVETLETGLRQQIAFVLGRRDTFGYLKSSSLGVTAHIAGSVAGTANRHAEWLERYQTRFGEARSEDFVRHYVEKYEGFLPIWVAVEILDFGLLVQLMDLLRDDDKTEVGSAFGFPSGKVVLKWMKQLKNVRNIAAHHSRLWNRRFTYSVPKPPARVVHAIDHLREMPTLDLSKLYAVATIVANMISSFDPNSVWPKSFVELIEAFPGSLDLSPERDMGFPPDWLSHQIWAQRPR